MSSRPRQDQMPSDLAMQMLMAAGIAISSSPETCLGAGVDWTGRFCGPVIAVVRPKSTDEVVAVMKVACEYGIPIQVQGGNTGLVGGSVPAPGHPALVLSTSGLREIGAVDVAAGTITVGAGVTCAELAEAARRAGRYFAVDLAARDSATVGGMVATNAGGIRVCAYGMMSAQVRGVQAVLADGRVISNLHGLPKDNTGYHLGDLMIGSEGTLGVVTAVTIGLHSPAPASSLAMVGVDTLAQGTAIAAQIAHGPYPLLAAEMLQAQGLALVAAIEGWTPPQVGEHPFVMLVEVGDEGTCDGLEPIGELDGAVALDAAERGRLWAYREGQTLAYATTAGVERPVHKLDVSVPLGALDDLVTLSSRALDAVPDVIGVGIFGHLFDGNLHFEVWGPDADDERADAAILGVVAELGGSISAEHGVGRAKTGFLGMTRSAAEIAVMRDIKAALDPRDLLNPGVIFPADPAVPAVAGTRGSLVAPVLGS